MMKDDEDDEDSDVGLLAERCLSFMTFIRNLICGSINSLVPNHISLFLSLLTRNQVLSSALPVTT
jgi:hypothetical protein